MVERNVSLWTKNCVVNHRSAIPLAVFSWSQQCTPLGRILTRRPGRGRLVQSAFKFGAALWDLSRRTLSAEPTSKSNRWHLAYGLMSWSFRSISFLIIQHNCRGAQGLERTRDCVSTGVHVMSVPAGIPPPPPVLTASDRWFMWKQHYPGAHREGKDPAGIWIHT